MNPSIIDFNTLNNKDHILIDKILELYKKNKKKIDSFSKSHKKDNEFALVLEKENNSNLAKKLKKEQIIDENIIMTLISETEELLLKLKNNNIENKIKNIEDKDLLKKISNEMGSYNKIYKNLNKQIIKLGIEYYKRKYLRYKLKYVFDN